MPAPSRPPIGLLLASTAKTVSRAFDDAMYAAGGSRPEWLILLALKTRTVASQRELADHLGIKGATLTHHLHTLERNGVITRSRDDDNRRVQFVELTPRGEEQFLRLRAAAMAFDKRLRRGVSDGDVATFEKVLSRLAVNADDQRA